MHTRVYKALQAPFEQRRSMNGLLQWSTRLTHLACLLQSAIYHFAKTWAQFKSMIHDFESKYHRRQHLSTFSLLFYISTFRFVSFLDNLTWYEAYI